MAQNKSAFLDLTDLIEKEMPNLKAAFEADPELKAVCTSHSWLMHITSPQTFGRSGSFFGKL